MYSMHGMRKKLSEEGALNHILIRKHFIRYKDGVNEQIDARLTVTGNGCYQSCIAGFKEGGVNNGT